jgi:perosamine synthetase
MIPVNVPLLAEEDIKTVEQAMREGWISSAGRYVEEFEQSWAAYCGCTDGIAVSNGSTALQVAVEAVGIGPGDEVIMPTYTIISCASAIVRAGAIPVLVDSEPAHWGMDVTAIAEKITPRTKAIMVVHMFGHPLDMDPIVALAEKHGLVIIEDAAQTHGAKYQSGWRNGVGAWKTCGGLGHISTFSFFANKLITTGEGGMVVTSNPEYAERSRSLRNLCFRPDRRFKHTEHGYQFRLTSLQSALALGQVRRIESIVELKRKAAALYTERLQDLQVLQLPTEEKWARSVFWVYAIVLADDVAWDATSFAAKLRQLGVETRPFFLGMHEQPVFHDMGLFKDEKHPVSERVAKRGLYLPSGLAITEAQIDEVSEKVRIALRSKPGE